MVAAVLSDALKESGQRMLAALDEIGLSPQGAAWIYDHELGDWGYYVFSGFVDALGKKRVYGLVADALDIIGAPEGMTVFDIHILSPNDPLFLTIANVINVDGGMITFENCNFNGVKVDGVFYRFTRTPPEPDLRGLAKAFERKVATLVKSP